jgi:hypothetical protein
MASVKNTTLTPEQETEQQVALFKVTVKEKGNVP